MARKEILIKQLSYNDFKKLFNVYYKPLCVFSLKYLDSFVKAEDIVQEVFSNFWKIYAGRSFKGSVKTYLFTSVKNNSLKHIKQEGKYIFEDIEKYADKFIEEKFKDEEIEKKKEILLTEIEKLPPKCREVFKAIVFDNLPYKEIAEKQEISLNTVKTHFSRALKQLRNSLEIITILLLP